MFNDSYLMVHAIVTNLEPSHGFGANYENLRFTGQAFYRQEVGPQRMPTE
jgi:hypothetical protein